MRDKIKTALLPHENAPEFLAALEFTQGITGFRSELIEKDYFCSLVLSAIFESEAHGLVFKGGTCLNKVHLGFFRLSEDLDFSMSLPANATRGARSAKVRPMKTIIEQIALRIAGCSLASPLVGANNSTQYNGEIEYVSALSNDAGRIKIEVGLREELLEESIQVDAATLIQNPFTRRPIVNPIKITCLSLQEAMAEKVRAIFTRKDVAIRDFFDFWHVIQATKMNPKEPKFIAMVAEKIRTSTTPYIELSPERVNSLKSQMLTDLRPVLTETTYSAFPLSESISAAKELEPLII
jgi:predicted nucleotidyltransferase component of viral defense system